MNKRLVKGISLVLSVAMVLSLLPANVAFAAEYNAKNQINISLEGETDPLPSVSEEPSPSPEPSTTVQPEPSTEPSSTVQPEPIPSNEQTIIPEQSSSTVIEYKSVTLESLVDENGYLTDEGLLSLQSLPYEPEKFIENVDNGDGTKSLKLYASPIKYKDEKGEYVKIDNSIVAKDGFKNSYKNKASDIEISMSDNLNKSNAIEYKYQDYSIGFMPLNMLKKQDGKSSAALNFLNSGKAQKADTLFNISKKYNSVEYSRTFSENSNIRITPTSSGVKEDIILNKIPKETEYSYELKVTNVIPLLRQDGNLYFVDLSKGMIVAVIPVPSMYDSTPESGPVDIPVTLKKIDENTYKYTLIPDQEFLKNAVYPVTIDPSVNSPTGGIVDTFVDSKNSGTNYVNSSWMSVGRDSSDYKHRAYIVFNGTGMAYIRQVTSGCAITQVTYNAYESYDGSSSPSIEVHQITSGWGYNTICWSSQPSFDVNAYCSRTVQGIGWYSWDITNMGIGWWNDTIPNCGIMLKITNEDSHYYKEFNVDEDSSNKDCFIYTYYAPPSAPASVTLNALGWTWLNYNPTLSWSGITPASGTSLVGVQYSYDSGASWNWVPGVCGDYSNGYSASINWPDGLYWVIVRGVNNYWYTGPASTSNVPIYVDKTPPNPSSFNSLTKTDGAYGSGDTATINIGVSSVSDFPSGTASGTQTYEVYIWNASTGTIGAKVGSLTQAQVSGGQKISLPNTTYYPTVYDNTTYYFIVKAIDAAGNFSWSPVSNAVTTADRTGPTAPASLYLTDDRDNVNPLGINYTNDISPTIHWSGVADAEGNHGVKQVKYSFNNIDWYPIDPAKGTGSGQADIDCSSLPDGENTIWLRGIDNVDSTGNPGASANIKYYKDTKAPYTEITPLTNSNVYGEVTISSTMYDDGLAGNHFSGWVLEYGEGENPSAYHEITSGTVPVTQISWDTSALAENHKYSLRLRAWDSAGNDSSEDENNLNDTIVVTKVYNATSVSAQLNITNPAASEINNQNVTVEYDGPSDLTDELIIGNEPVSGGLSFDAAQYDAVKGSFVYPEGSTVYMYAHGQDASGNDYYSYGTDDTIVISDGFEDSGQIIIASESAGKLDISENKIQLAKYDESNYCPSAEFTYEMKTLGGDISYLLLNTLQTTPVNTSITYNYSVDGVNWSAISPSTKVYLDEIVDSIKLKVILTTTDPTVTPDIDSLELVARNFIDADLVPILNDFSDTERGIVNPDRVIKVNGIIELVADDLGIHAGEGSFMTETKNLGGNVKEVTLTTVDTAETGTSIEYLVSADGGTNWQTIIPDECTGIVNKGKELILKAVLTTTDSSKTPSIDNWSLHAVVEASGQAYTVNLIDAPANLTAQANVNYKTLLRWDASTTEGVTYNVYRDTTPYYTPSEDTLIQSGIIESYWSDYNLNYGITFYYKVTAVKSFDGVNKRESLPTNDAQSKVVDEDEVQKQLGLEDYWGFAAFQTGSGQGYVNVSKGNLSYITTDLVISDPFLGMVMRRTYNSQAETETALGRGWDFSFNTCLLKEWGYVEGELVPVAMILKDGDGSFHRFEGNDETGYTPAKGTFMTLSKVNNEYIIERKDYIKYHFNGDTLKLNAFSDLNGNTLSFTYDARGNAETVTNTVGDVLTLSYENDILKTVTSSDGRVYNYHYDNSIVGKFDYMETAVEDGAYRESFTYDENGILETIIDPRNYRENSGKHTTIDCDADGKVLSITDASGEWYEYSYQDTLQDVAGIDTTTVTRKWSDNGTERTGAVMGYKYDAEGLILEKTDPSGNSTAYENIEDYYLVKSVTYKNQDSGGNDYWVRNCYEYDGDNNNIVHGNITHITAQSSTDGDNFTPLTVSIANSTAPAQTPETIITYHTKYTNMPKTKSVKISDGATDAEDKWTSTTYEYTDNAEGKLERVSETVSVEGAKTKSSIRVYGLVNNHWGYLISVIDNFGKKTAYEYNPKGQVQDVKEYNNDNQPVRTVTEYEYDNYGRTDKITDAMGNVTDVHYDILGRKVSETYPNADTEDNNDTVIWQYDLSGNLKRTVDRNGNDTEYQYDDLNRLERTDYADGTFDTASYSGRWDSNNDGAADSDIVVKTAGQYSGSGGLGLNEGNGSTTNEYYDLMGRLKKSTQGTRGSSEVLPVVYQYDLVGNMIHVTDVAGRESEAQYDKLGRKVLVTLDPDNENIATETGYDLLGNVLTSEDGQGNITRYTYDNTSRVKTVTQTIDSRNITTSYSYDNLVTQENGQTIIMNKTTDAMGREKLTYFDEMGRKLSEVNDGVTTDTTKISTEYHYNDNFQPVVIKRNDGTMEKYSYNALNQVTKIDYYQDKPNDGVTMTWQGLADGSYTVTPDNTTEYTYHESGSVQTESAKKDGNLVHETGYNYDNMNRMLNIQESAGLGGLYISYGYDYMNVVSDISYIKDSVTKDIGYSYDPLGRLSQVSLDGDKVRDYEYSSSTGELVNVNSYRQFEQTPDGLKYADYIQEHYTYDTLGRIDLFTYTDNNYDDTTGTLTTAQKESYDLSYDDRGFITGENITTNYGLAVTTNKHYDYDTLGRLETVTVNGTVNSAYEYDDVGNRTRMTEGAAHYDYTYDTTGFNQLTTVNKDDILDQSYTYDGRGNQTKEQVQKDFNGTVKTQTTDYTYDLMNQMTQAIISAQGELTTVSQNVYNVEGQRVTRLDGTWTDASDGGTYDNNTIDKDDDGLVVAAEITSPDTSRYYYTGGALLYSANANNSLLTENILDPSGSIIASKRFDQQYSGYYFYDYDYRGSTTAIIAPNGTLVKAYTYNEYGKMQETTQSTFNNEVTFTSSVTDESTGLQYMNSRFYNPSTGRFLSQDTYSGNAYEPWTQHLYSYAGNNPVNFIDPTGHATQVTYFDGKVSHTVVVPNPEQGDKKFKPYDPAERAKKQKALSKVTDTVLANASDSNVAKVLSYLTSGNEKGLFSEKTVTEGGSYDISVKGEADVIWATNLVISPIKAKKRGDEETAAALKSLMSDLTGYAGAFGDIVSAAVATGDLYKGLKEKATEYFDYDDMIYDGEYYVYNFSTTSRDMFSNSIGDYSVVIRTDTINSHTPYVKVIGYENSTTSCLGFSDFKTFDRSCYLNVPQD